MPAAQIGHGMADLVTSYMQHPLPILAGSGALALMAMLGLGVVAPATEIVIGTKKAELAAFATNVARLSLSVILVYYIWFITSLPGRVRAYVDGTDAVRTALSVSYPGVLPTWIAWFMFGFMGLFVATIGCITMADRSMPKCFAVVCFTKSFGFWLALAGIAVGSTPIFRSGIVIGGLIGGPIYHIWLGLELRKMRQPITQPCAD
jgi:hypothetical protein